MSDLYTRLLEAYVQDVGLGADEDPVDLTPELEVSADPWPHAIPDSEVPGQLTMEEVARAQRVDATRVEALGPGSSLSEGLIYQGYRNTAVGVPSAASDPGHAPEVPTRG